MSILQDQAMEQRFYAHSGMLKTAKAIWQDLEVLQIIRTFLYTKSLLQMKLEFPQLINFGAIVVASQTKLGL